MAKNNLSIWFSLAGISLAGINTLLATDAMADESQSSVDWGMRTRWQHVTDQRLGDTNAFTTRLSLTGKFNLAALTSNSNWSLGITGNYVWSPDETFNSVTITRAGSPVPDPVGFNLNQGFLHYAGVTNWSMTLGRQLIALDNERFVGSVEFWQTPQSFDAAKFDYNDQVHWHIQYAYLQQVNRIFGHQATHNLAKEDIRYATLPERPVNEWGVHKLNSHLFNASYKTDHNRHFTIYGYFNDNEDQPLFSNNTFGINITEQVKPAHLKYSYTAEYARQYGAYNNPNTYQAWYSLLQAGIQYNSHSVELTQEILSEDNYIGFVTPLATNHKFQGWADIFTGYGMQTGLRDRYFTYQGRNNKLRWRIVWHDFKGYAHGEHIGQELDLEVGYHINRQWQVKLIYANYQTLDGLKYFPKANYDLTTWMMSIAYNI
jgi:hypothetical protein